ncbi:MAG: guanylate kinase [Defluviitaleaceae bacterium]|nr:guanylate kinase [Defluviitaleaceae bacterium]
MDRTMGMLVIISGPSGSGKGTVVKKLDPDMGYAVSTSVTTRNPRVGEVNGKDYFFISEEEFVKMREEHQLLEHFAYVGNYYGTPKPYVERQIAEGKIVVLEIEVNGALQVKEKFPDAVLVFLMPPTFTELERRLVNRGTENAVTIEDRLKKSLEEIPLIDQYDYLVINDEVARAVAKVDALVMAERLKPVRNQQTIKDFASSQVKMEHYKL